jgi:L-amino acid N-acyltransferase YncA
LSGADIECNAMNSIEIRHIRPRDHADFLAIARQVARRGDTYVFDQTTTDAELADYWLHHGEVRVAVVDGRVVGGYLLKPNQPWRGSHIANAGYIVDESVRGGGIGRALCRDSVRRAVELGYRGMQFNIVVETNTGAVGLWLSEGFRIIGTVPGVFRHTDGRFVGAHVMFRALKSDTTGPGAVGS